MQLQKSCLRSKVCSLYFDVIHYAEIARDVQRSLHAHLPRYVDSLLQLHINVSAEYIQVFGGGAHRASHCSYNVASFSPSLLGVYL